DGLADAGGMFDHAFIGHRVDGGDGGRAGQRVTRVGQSAGVDAFGEGLEDRVVDDHPAQRHIPGVHALGEGDEVGDDVEVLEGNHLPERPKPAITSSAMKMIPYSSASARTPCMYSRL